MEILPTELKILSPLEGPIFRMLLASKRSKPILVDFISAIIEQPVVRANVYSNSSLIGSREEKNNLLYVHCGIFEGAEIDIELEAEREPEEGGSGNPKRSSIYKLCDFYSIQRIDEEEKEKPNYYVTLSRETLFPERSGYFHTFTLRHDEDYRQLTEKENICAVYVELKKLEEVIKKPVNEMTGMETVSYTNIKMTTILLV